MWYCLYVTPRMGMLKGGCVFSKTFNQINDGDYHFRL